MTIKILRRPFVWLAAATLLLGARCSAQGTSIQYATLPRDVIERHLKLAALDNAERAQNLKTLFQEAGCRDEHLTEQPVKHQRVPNLICVQPGTTQEVIMVGGHMDHVKEGRGVVDDWSGAALLPSLYESLRDQPRKHTFVFVGFTDEEDGLVGSKFYVKQLTPDEAANIRAMVNLECLGLTPSKVWAHHADPKLLSSLVSLANSLPLPLAAVNVENAGDDDADSFRARRVPTITIHSVTTETWPILHSRLDDFSAIHEDDYYDSYRLIAAYLAYLDQSLD
jgi:putative aminopeptidase FrvX